ncbi:MAG: GNAT family N-acetyltransferase [Oscillospiraceae bacterium]|nr:GNAT family N-acetyltransferase [Oscillospiraceae bacterium]
MIRLATEKDIDRVEEIYTAIHDEEEAGRVTIGWNRNIYPVRQTAIDALGRGDLFVEELEGQITATGIINRTQLPEYADCQWSHDPPEDRIMVLHTLVVDPAAKARGYGKAFIDFYERYALERDCPYLRIDTQAKNKNARRFYAGLGYKEMGIVPCMFYGIGMVQLVCIEKTL